MQMTTREAVELSLYALAASGNETDEKAAKLLCEHYGFKLSQFFDVEVVE